MLYQYGQCDASKYSYTQNATSFVKDSRGDENAYIVTNQCRETPSIFDLGVSA
jgi:hypothetical protein